MPTYALLKICHDKCYISFWCWHPLSINVIKMQNRPLQYIIICLIHPNSTLYLKSVYACKLALVVAKGGVFHIGGVVAFFFFCGDLASGLGDVLALSFFFFFHVPCIASFTMFLHMLPLITSRADSQITQTPPPENIATIKTKSS